MIWVLLAISAGVIWAVSNLIDKYIVEESVQSVWSVFVVFAITDIFVAIPLLLLFPVDFTQLPWPLLLLTNALEFIALLCYFLALQYESAIKVVPIFTFSTAVVAITDAALLGHVVAPIIYLAIAVIVIAGFLLARDPQQGVTRNALVFLLMMISASCYGVLWVVADSIIEIIPADDYTVLTLLFSLSYLPIGIIGLMFTRTQYITHSIRNIFSKNALVPGVLSSATAIVGTLCYSYALSLGGIPTLVETFSMAQHIAIVIIPLALWPFFSIFERERLSRTQTLIKSMYIFIMMACAAIILQNI